MKRFIISESEKKYIRKLHQLNEIDSDKFAKQFLDYALELAKKSEDENNDNKNDTDTEDNSIEYSGDKLYSPLKDLKTSPGSGFGILRNADIEYAKLRGKKPVPHPGVDYTAASGTELYSPGNGIVLDAELRNDGCGGTLKIKHSDEITTRYCHLKKLFVKKDDKVKIGQKVGLTGGGDGDNNPGFSKGAHLHMELYVNGKLADPDKYIIPKLYDEGDSV
jgi:murein DD-endopeptidase MepM/ murein hydrolase activator NlpD